jgi:flagellar export protein FliJ
MKRFRFSLDALLSLRREREQECEIALAHAVGKLAEIDGRIEQARLSGERAFEDREASLDALRARERIWAKSVADIKALERPRREAAAGVDESRQVYAEAHSQWAALDRIRELRFQEWRAEARKEEIRRLDETAGGAAVRKRLTGGDL